MIKTKATATAKNVRAFFNANPELIPTDGAMSLREGQRGRLHPAAVEAFNEKSGMEYAEGNTPTMTIPFIKVSKSGAKLQREVSLPISVARSLAGDAAGLRGRLSPTAKIVAGEQYAKTLLSV